MCSHTLECVCVCVRVTLPQWLSVPGAAPSSPRKELYKPILSPLREVLIRRTPRPEEVLIEQDDSGDIVRSTTKDTDAIAMYKTMKDTLVFLTHLDYADTEAIMLDKLAKQVWRSLVHHVCAHGCVCARVCARVRAGGRVGVWMGSPELPVLGGGCHLRHHERRGPCVCVCECVCVWGGVCVCVCVSIPHPDLTLSTRSATSTPSSRICWACVR